MSVSVDSAVAPTEVIFLGTILNGVETGGFDYRDPAHNAVNPATGIRVDDGVKFRDESGREIIRITPDVTLPFTIHCFGHHMTFDHVGQIGDNMYELRRENERFMLYRYDSV